MRRIRTVIWLALLAAWCWPALGNPIVDQSQTGFNSGAFVQGTISMAQTFTPSISGDFAELDLFMANHDTAEGQPLIASIYATQGGLPSTMLGTEDLNGVGNSYAWYALDFSGANIHLNANNLYAFVLSCPGTFYGLYVGGTTYDSYPWGMSLEQDYPGAPWQTYSRAQDLTFYTCMTVPDSTGPGIMAISALFLICCYRILRPSRNA